MLNKNKKNKIFTRRILILGGIKFALFSSLIIRLGYLQIVKSDQYKTLSDSNRIRLFLVPPIRGQILDRFGEPFAINKNYYRILFSPEPDAHPEKSITELVKILNLSEADHKKMVKKLHSTRSGNTLSLYDHLTWEQVAKAEVHAPDLPGISIHIGQIRHFPMDEVTPHAIGYLGAVSEADIHANPLLNHPDFKVGKSGIEKRFEGQLRGTAGVSKMEVNAFGLPVRQLAKRNSVSGKDITLTLDKRLQAYAGKRLADTSGSVVILDTHNGEILTMVSTPGYDPNQFTYGITTEYWNSLLDNPDKPLANKAISHQYPPGSTFKPIVALAALKQGISPSTIFHCSGSVSLGHKKFHCWKAGGHGKLDMVGALMHSCNTYFYQVAKKIGITPIADMARLFALGVPSGIILDHEKPGLVPDSNWKLNTYHHSWQTGDTLNVAIGQGYMLTTPLQLAIMVARLAKGTAISPTLIASEDPFVSFPDLAIDNNHLSVIQQGMKHVVNTPGGTAYGSRILDEPFTMAGKTGTSQVISRKKLSHIVDHLDEKQKHRTKNHALFVGYAPVNQPRYAISVVIEHGGGGSAAAAPVARDVLTQLYKLYGT